MPLFSCHAPPFLSFFAAFFIIFDFHFHFRYFAFALLLPPFSCRYCRLFLRFEAADAIIIFIAVLPLFCHFILFFILLLLIFHYFLDIADILAAPLPYYCHISPDIFRCRHYAAFSPTLIFFIFMPLLLFSIFSPLIFSATLSLSLMPFYFRHY